MLKIALINFWKLQEKTKQKSFSLFGIFANYDGKDFVSLTFAVWNFGLNFTSIAKNYIPSKERDEIKLRVLDKK